MSLWTTDVLLRFVSGIGARLLGLVVVLRGNRVRRYGLTFAVDSPGVLLRNKGLLQGGNYEHETIHLVRRHVDPALPVIELGGFIGVLACVTNGMLQQPTKHVVVEANPAVIDVLQRNRDANGCGFTVVNAALGYGAASRFLAVSGSRSSLKVTSGKGVEVPTIMLDALLKMLDATPVTLICDIEGSEVDLVANEGDLMARHVKLLVLETHPMFVDDAATNAMFARLRALGFEQVRQQHYDYVFKNTALSEPRGP